MPTKKELRYLWATKPWASDGHTIENSRGMHGGNTKREDEWLWANNPRGMHGGNTKKEDRFLWSHPAGWSEMHGGGIDSVVYHGKAIRIGDSMKMWNISSKTHQMARIVSIGPDSARPNLVKITGQFPDGKHAAIAIKA